MAERCITAQSERRVEDKPELTLSIYAPWVLKHILLLIDSARSQFNMNFL